MDIDINSRTGTQNSIMTSTADSAGEGTVPATVEEADFNCRADDPDGEERATTGGKLQLRLLILEEKDRSGLMRKQIDAFQDKVSLCFKTFNPDLLLLHIRALASLPTQNEILATSIHSLARLRMIVQQQLLRRASMRTDGSLYFAGKQQTSVEARCTQYFMWFFEFMDYLGELHQNFVERIFLPLFRFFHETTFLRSLGRTSASGSALSKLTHLSADSGETDDADNDIGNFADDDNDSMVERARRRAQFRLSLNLLSKEFADIKALYDTSEVESVAQRLSLLKEQVDFMLDEEDELDPDLFSADSAKLVQHLDMSEGTENLVRLPVDLLVKSRKAIWLARRWLDLDDRRTKDLRQMLQTIVSLESKLTQRLTSLDGRISSHERELERQTAAVQRLLQREERPEDLTLSLYDVDSDIRVIQVEVEGLRQQRDRITAKVVGASKRGLAQEYRRQKIEFEKNKLHRFLLERKLAALNYRRQLVEEDRRVELEVRPSLVRHTNHVQDTCERLEQRLRDERQERDNIRSALLPIQQDRQTLASQLARRGSQGFDRSSLTKAEAAEGLDSRGWGLHAGEAKFVRTHRSPRKSRAKPRAHVLPQNAQLQAPGWISPIEW